MMGNFFFSYCERIFITRVERALSGAPESPPACMPFRVALDSLAPRGVGAMTPSMPSRARRPAIDGLASFVESGANLERDATLRPFLSLSLSLLFFASFQ